MDQDKAIPNMRAPTVLMIAFGNSIHSLRPLNWLLEKGCRVIFLNGFNPYPGGRDGFAYVRYPKPFGGRIFPKLLGENIGTRLFRLSEWTTVLRLKGLWRRIRPDVVHVHWVDDRAYYCVKAGVRPLVLTVWGSDINNHFLPNANPTSRRRVAEALSGADLVLIDSADMHIKCADLTGRDLPTELFSLGLNTDQFRPGYAEAALEWRRKLRIPVNSTVLLSIRAWSSLYRHESILKAFARAVPQLNSNAILVFKILHRPSDEPALYEDEIHSLAEKLGVAQMVRWMEEVPLDRLPEIYSFANVILNYPSMDAFPVTFLEAAACECPVISCRLPAYAGTFAEEYFHLVSYDDLSELSDAIVEFVNQNRSADRGRLAELRRLVRRDHDEGVTAGRLMDIYLKLLSS
jgi:glycosyltransferase involved in cell wall biosynthesis